MLQQKESYDVLRLIEHGQLCYISSENVQGKTLDRYLKYHPVIKKREIFIIKRDSRTTGVISQVQGKSLLSICKSI